MSLGGAPILLLGGNLGCPSRQRPTRTPGAPYRDDVAPEAFAFSEDSTGRSWGQADPHRVLRHLQLGRARLSVSVRQSVLSVCHLSLHLFTSLHPHVSTGRWALARRRPMHPDVSLLGIRTGPAGAGPGRKVGFGCGGRGPPREIWSERVLGATQEPCRAPAEGEPGGQGPRGLLRGSLVDSPEPELVFLLHRNSIFFSHWCPSWAFL